MMCKFAGMRTKHPSTILLLALSATASVHAQNSTGYDSLVSKAFAFYEEKDFLTSAQTYSAAFRSNEWKGLPNDRYNAACAWSLAGSPDSAFFQLNRIAVMSQYANIAHMTSDTDLTSLHGDARWEPLCQLVRANKERIEANYDKPLVALLDSIEQEDQGLRQQMDAVEAEHGRDSEQMKELWRKMREKDSLNLIVVKNILDTRGWLGAAVVGSNGNTTLFLVIQHSDQATQEYYLPMMREAVAKGNARSSSLALLEDRVALGQGRRQTYGSQIGRDPTTGAYYVSPLDDPEHVDERRAAMGLPLLADYLRNWDLTWDPTTYAKELPSLEEKRKALKK
jgi:hypothetical protein